MDGSSIRAAGWSVAAASSVLPRRAEGTHEAEPRRYLGCHSLRVERHHHASARREARDRALPDPTQSLEARRRRSDHQKRDQSTRRRRLEPEFVVGYFSGIAEYTLP